ncbi:hypothetical protein POM88_015466 [Heracleum sosnowskyi]|uniref:Signal transduction histidine kinase dimerisation/phosphoacceptor domain-containing protein n=1 Tax=Heracleum sosnowskyi TaxID=360622 RepID=A0AAD8MXG5_9APIA|nr:hypothetical protein POM88_015466 [Heracleum sosnowskyi]
MEGQVIVAFCFLQIASPELQQALEVHRQQENKSYGRMKELAYICQEIKKPLSGIRFTNSLLEVTNLTEDQKQFLETSAACEKQTLKIIKDVNLEQIDDRYCGTGNFKCFITKTRDLSTVNYVVWRRNETCKTDDQSFCVSMGVAADSWIAFTDKFLTLDDNSNEKNNLKKKMLKLIDIYYDALDAPKSGKEDDIDEITWQTYKGQLTEKWLDTGPTDSDCS